MLLRFLLKNVRQPALMCIASKCRRSSIIAGITDIKSVRFLNGSSVRYSSRRSSGIDRAAENSTDELSTEEIRALEVNSDKFGTLSSIAETSPAPTPEKDDTIVKKHDGILLQQHADKINEFIENQNLEEAFRIFEEHVLKRDRLHPPISMFTRLFDDCVRYQMPEIAFRVFSHMIERRLQVSLDTIDKLIETCELLAQSTKKINVIQRFLTRTKQKPNASIYNGMIRCYIRSGQWKEGFALVDLMKADGFELENKTRPFILEGWSHDPKNGFCKVLENWHAMQQIGCKVNVDTINALLNCIQKCEIGDIDKLNKTIEMIRSKYNELSEKETETPLSSEQNEKINVTPKYFSDGRPKLLHSPPLKGFLLPFETVDDPQKRLLILGGLSGLLEIIKSNEISPTLNTIQLMLGVIPNTIHAENKVISLIKTHNLTLNVEFYQQILTRMSIRQDFQGAKSVVMWMKDQGVEVDLVAYGLWAVSCKSAKQAQIFLDYMGNEPRTSRPDIDVLNAMLTNATSLNDNDYIIEVLRYMCQENVEPDDISLRLIKDFKKDELARLKKFRKPDKRTRNEFFKISREYQQWVRHFNLDRRTLIDTEASKENRSGHEIRVNARLSKKALELSQKHNNLKGSGRDQKKVKRSGGKY